METNENTVFDVMLAVGLALAVVLIVMQKSSGITLFAQWGVPIELTMIMLITFFRAWALMMHRHLYRGLAWAIVAAAALVVPAYTHLI